MFPWFSKKRIYLDYASATPLLPEVEKAVAVGMRLFGNPSAPHTEGRAAYDAVQKARIEIARSLFVKPDELIFTSGGTEANNIAIRGVVEALRARGVPYSKQHIVSTALEHSSIIETLRTLESLGVVVSFVVPDEKGVVEPKKIVAALRPETVLVTLAHVNSECGVVQPVSDISHALSLWTKENTSAHSKLFPETTFPILHIDAAQSPLYLEASPHTLHASLVSYDAQKVCGPKGVGILYRDFSVPLVAVSGGGSQERSIRPGTENVPAIIGAGVAFAHAKEGRVARAEKVEALREYLIELVEKAVPSSELVGHRKRRVANNAFFVIPGIEGDYLAVRMDSEGVAVSPRSACVGGGGGLSHVVLALTGDEEKARSTIRFSLGPTTSRRDIDVAVRALQRCVQRVPLTSGK